MVAIVLTLQNGCISVSQVVRRIVDPESSYNIDQHGPVIGTPRLSLCPYPEPQNSRNYIKRKRNQDGQSHGIRCWRHGDYVCLQVPRR